MASEDPNEPLRTSWFSSWFYCASLNYPDIATSTSLSNPPLVFLESFVGVTDGEPLSNKLSKAKGYQSTDKAASLIYMQRKVSRKFPKADCHDPQCLRDSRNFFECLRRHDQES